MQYIDKTIFGIKNKAHTILKKFIDGQWQDESFAYINLTYEDFDNKSLCKLLLSEQNHFCCYCMKHILDNETTLEHIIPNKSKVLNDFEEYKIYGNISANVFFWERSMRTNRITPPPFPHILAYENLVASCNGFIPKDGLSKCCNNIRGSKRIIPFFYLVNAKDEFEYDINGMIICDIKYNDSIRFLALEHTTLQLFRRLWLNLPVKYDALDVIDASENEELRNQIVDDMDLNKISISDRTTMKDATYWSSFMNYFWFYLYKKAKGL